jgi:hypothetical protein
MVCNLYYVMCMHYVNKNISRISYKYEDKQDKHNITQQRKQHTIKQTQKPNK